MRAAYNLDKDLRFVSANETALQYWKRSWSEFMGRRMADVFPQVVGSGPYDAHLQTLRSFQPFHATVTSPVLAETIDLEIYPSADELRVSFLRLTGARKPTPAPLGDRAGT